MASGTESETKERAVKNSWNNMPMPELSKFIEVNLEYSSKDIENIKMGFIPQEMEEKWFIYFDDSESKLYFHRSWTGMCIYIVNFEEKDGKFVATKAEVNRDPSQYTCEDDDRDKESLKMILDCHLLGRFF